MALSSALVVLRILQPKALRSLNPKDPCIQCLTDITRKCTTLWGDPDRVHVQNMEQLHAYDCPQNVTEPQATARISRKSTHVYRGAESGLATNIYYIKHAVHRLVQHTLQVVEIAWTDDSTLAIFFYMRYR